MAGAFRQRPGAKSLRFDLVREGRDCEGLCILASARLAGSAKPMKLTGRAVCINMALEILYFVAISDLDAGFVATPVACSDASVMAISRFQSSLQNDQISKCVPKHPQIQWSTPRIEKVFAIHGWVLNSISSSV